MFAAFSRVPKWAVTDVNYFLPQRQLKFRFFRPALSVHRRSPKTRLSEALQATISVRSISNISPFSAFFGLFNSIAGDIHLQNYTVVNQPIDGGSCGHRVFKD